MGEMLALSVLEPLNKVESLDEGLILRRRMEGQQMGQAKEFGSVRPIKAPHQGPIVIVVVG